MKRYQVYLNPNSISVIDEFEKYTSISRSQLIREAIDRLAQNLSKVFVDKNIFPDKKIILDTLVGVITLKESQQTNFASKDDRAYLND